jgi:hypothetical protein
MNVLVMECRPNRKKYLHKYYNNKLFFYYEPLKKLGYNRAQLRFLRKQTQRKQGTVMMTWESVISQIKVLTPKRYRPLRILV